ncbi:glycosyltransferase family 2 protein [Acidipila sp. EB88]|uniref:glycosyltransferase family 2 protein n=1 Tax=Acidipila sp. EB88 TaxID=2305226 RepID=UPI000F5E64B8|nr:glycosyltransferase family A protein [Acidipila sp. EB88]RRA47197.1 glycosyltransferase family 2 protein [Acidipila sp. EB88]
MKLSLVVATLGRTLELHDLLAGFAAQPFHDFDVVIVDQNGDSRLDGIVAEFEHRFPILHLRSDVKNVSHARNVGLAAATGEIVGFPDDDCQFQRNTMMLAMRHFEQDPQLALLAGNYINPQGKRVNGRWTARSCEVNDKTVWTTVQASSLWVRTHAAREVGGFDTAIGPGTPWGSGEEPDFVIRVLRRGYRGYYDVTLGVLHPDKSLNPVAGERAFKYGAGMGRVLRKHGIALRITLPYFYRPIGGVLWSLLRVRMNFASYYWGTFRGRVFGYMATPARSSP